MVRTVLAVALTAGILTGPAVAPATAAGAAGDPPPAVALVPDPETTFRVGERRYGGPLGIRAVDGGLVLTETVPLDGYLAGIREVPGSWPRAALRAQAVAARTYLAYTLARGRRGRAARYRYDICASSACQVYAGVGGRDTAGGRRWAAAVADTAGEILTYQGRPAEAVYSASAGTRTRANQDVWGGTPIPYLQPVDSPEAGVSPWTSWRFRIPAGAFVTFLHAAGYDAGGALQAVRIDDPGEGNGRATLVVTTTTGTVTLPAPKLKGILNRWAPRLYPETYPARRPDGHRLPQTLPSYRFDITFRPLAVPPAVARRLPPEDAAPPPLVIAGEGWGHGVGMSQWGAKAMADAGADYRTILAHYYGGLQPVVDPTAVPDRVVVALDVDRELLTVTASGPFTLRRHGTPVVRLPAGTWTFRTAGEAVRVAPPGVPPRPGRARAGGHRPE